MLAILCTALFAAAAVLAAGTIHSSLRRHAAQALALVRSARAVPETREYRVRMIEPVAAEHAALAFPHLRRQPRRAVSFRPALRQTAQRAAA